MDTAVGRVQVSQARTSDPNLPHKRHKSRGKPWQAAQALENLVELVGIEPTTSSLRILNPVRDDATPKKFE